MLKKSASPLRYGKVLLISSVFALISGSLQAQTVTIFRSSTPVFSYPTVEAAITASLPGDSLVLSAHTFRENNLTINKNLKISGISGMSTIDAALKSRVLLINSGDVLLQDIIFTNGKVLNSSGGAICNFGTGTLTLTGNCVVSSSSCSGIYANGGGIFSAGKLFLSGNTSVSENHATDNGGGVYAYTTFVLSNKAKIAKNKTDGSGGGVFGAANGGITITDFAAVENNTAADAGGGVFGPGMFSGQATITGNKAASGGGICSFKDAVFIQDSVKINNNTALTSGAGLWLNNANLAAKGDFEINENKITSLTGILNFGGAIYCVNGNIDIHGGTITGNRSPVAAVYVSYALNTLTLNSCHLYNPGESGKRQPEVYVRKGTATSKIVFSSDSCWWGSNYIPELVHNDGSSFTGGIHSSVTLQWWLNDGLPLDPDTAKFKLEAYFFVNDEGTLDTLKLRSIKGYFTATKGSFTPPVSWIAKSNIISSVYNAPGMSDSTIITAWVDGDTFRSAKIKVPENLSVQHKTLPHHIRIYPNPVSETLFITEARAGTVMTLYTIEGKIQVQKVLSAQTEQISTSGLPAGIYLLSLTDKSGNRHTAQIIKQ